MPRWTLARRSASSVSSNARLHFFAFDLPHSDACFVIAYPAETTEAFCDGHVRAFAFFGGVPKSILYDNTKLAVVRILGNGQRQRTRVFAELQLHYLFEDRFGRPGKGNDKGKVEGLVGLLHGATVARYMYFYILLCSDPSRPEWRSPGNHHEVR